MDRRVPPSSREIAGATLTVSTMGGYSVTYDGEYIGFIHATVGDRWNAYVRRVGELDHHLGRFGQEEAVRRIVLAAAEAAADRAVR
jgi:hypothetical protein